MRKKIAVSSMLNFFLATLIVTSTIGPAEASITGTPSWIGPQYNDPLLGTVIAFKENSTATLLVTVRNDYTTKQLNVSAVKVRPDWNVNYSSTEANATTPLVIPPSSGGVWQYHTFTIGFTVPSTSIASNLFKHRYWIYVEEVNATTGPQTVSSHAVTSGYDLVVYSDKQYDAQTLRQEIDRTFAQYPSVGSVSSADAKTLWTDATMEKNAGEESYKNRDFTSAKTHYQTALTLLDQMITAENTYQTRNQENTLKSNEASTKYTEAMATQLEALANASITNATATLKKAEAAMIEANATMRMADAAWIQADAARYQGYSWNLFGLGFILFAVAAIVYAWRKPKSPTQL